MTWDFCNILDMFPTVLYAKFISRNLPVFGGLFQTTRRGYHQLGVVLK